MSSTQIIPKSAFKVYEHIEQHYREKFVTAVQESAPNDEIWYATEKIHGSNFSWLIGSSTVRTEIEIKRARRGNFLGDTEEFYGSLAVLKKYRSSLVKFYGLCQDRLERKNIVLQLVGEIYGGSYPGATSLTKTKAVQKEIKYCPDVDVRLFDVMIDGNYQNYLEMIPLLDQCQLPYCQVQHQGSLEEMLKLDPMFPTTIPALYGLEPIENNDAEGYVLKPVIARFIQFSEDSTERVIFKLKNPKFSEKDEVTKAVGDNDLTTSTKVLVPLADNLQVTTLSYINQNRMDNVMSKMTEIEKKNKGKVIQGLIRDVIDEVMRDLTDSGQLTEEIKKSVQTLIKKQVPPFVMAKI